MKKAKFCVLGLIICIFLSACGKSAAGTKAAQQAELSYGQIRCDFSGMTPEIAKAYLAAVDELAAHLGYDEAEASGGEFLHGGFVRDWDGDGTPELCLLLRTSPRENGSWDGTPLYGWYPPTLYLYTVRNGQPVLAGSFDLYFATAGREAAVAVLMTGDGLQAVWRDRSELMDETAVDCFELRDGALQKAEASADVAAASQGAETAHEFLDALGSDKAQLLLYNYSGEASIDGEANARELRAALSEKAAGGD